METMTDFLFLESKITADGDCHHEMKRRLLLWRKAVTNLDSILKSRDYYFANKSPSSQSYGFSISHVWMWELDHKEGWAPKNWCSWTVVLEKTVENPLDCKEIKPVHHKENQPWMFTGRTEAPAPVLWPPDTKSWLIGKDPGAVKDRRQEKKGMTGQDGWHHLLSGHELEQALEEDERQRSLECCSPWSGRERRLSDWTTTVGLLTG